MNKQIAVIASTTDIELPLTVQHYLNYDKDPSTLDI